MVHRYRSSCRHGTLCNPIIGLKFHVHRIGSSRIRCEEKSRKCPLARFTRERTLIARCSNGRAVPQAVRAVQRAVQEVNRRKSSVLSETRLLVPPSLSTKCGDRDHYFPVRARSARSGRRAVPRHAGRPYRAQRAERASEGNDARELPRTANPTATCVIKHSDTLARH